MQIKDTINLLKDTITQLIQIGSLVVNLNKILSLKMKIMEQNLKVNALAVEVSTGEKIVHSLIVNVFHVRKLVT